MKKVLKTVLTIVALVALVGMIVFAGVLSWGKDGALVGTAWALFPPLVAIALALITKEVYSSLFVGVLVGGLFYTGFNPEQTVLHVFNEGFVGVLSDGGNVGILIFLVLLGAIVALMNKAGGSAAFGRWASQRIKTAKGAQLSTIALGVLIFIDDYFNCLTVGSVMRPVTDKHKVSRPQLAYLIDATAAPVCIIAPISSWAAAVTSSVERDDGFTLFLQSIPYNYYALLTIVMMVGMVLLGIQMRGMAKVKFGEYHTDASADEIPVGKGGVIELIMPIATLIVSCIIAMLYTGGFFSGVDLINAFANCDATVALPIGSAFALVLTIAWYLLRRVLNFTQIMACIPEGFKSMTGAILILTLAWTLNTITGSLDASAFVESLVKASAGSLMNLLPAVVFLVGGFLSFATGTSWGTFGILIPIVVDAFSTDPQLMVIAISACMAGAVCGDHCSPISDTTIMASAGAQCDHVTHVSTQLPYAVTCAAISCVAYVAAGFIRNVYISLAIAVVLMVGVILLMWLRQRKAAATQATA